LCGWACFDLILIWQALAKDRTRRYNPWVYLKEKKALSVIHRQTQTAEYWNSFRVKPEDAEFIYGAMLDSGRPMRSNELAQNLLQQHVERENAALRKQLSGDAAVYLPRNTYAVGDLLSFPLIGFATGTVTAIRQSNTGEGEHFPIISVDMSDGVRREFASAYPLPHPLNDLDVNALTSADTLKTPEELFALHGAALTGTVEASLKTNTEYIQIGEEWFLRAMMTEVNVGHLNLAEAVLEMANGAPLTTDVILRDLGLPADVGANVQEASLNSALANDPRFDEVSVTDVPAWVLRRAEPAEVAERPALLRPSVWAGATTLSEDLNALVASIDDELDVDHTGVESATSATVILTFTHRRAGTLGWGRKLASVLPHSDKPRFPVTLRDRATQKEFIVWLVRDGSYIWGLAEFYRSADLPAGAEIVLSAAERPGLYWIDGKKRKPKRDWVRVGHASNGHLRLETAQRAVACEFDDQMAIFTDDIKQLDSLRDGRELAAVVREAFLEIAKLSPQGNVHARTLYAVVNTMTRASAKNVFAALVSSGQFVVVGDNYWHLAER
jgi:hypothetical protein